MLLLHGNSGNPNAALDASIRSKLTSYWKLDEASGTRADSIGSNNLTANGTGGVGSTTGKLGNAAAFVGAESDYLSITDNTSISIGNNSCEFCLWVYSSGSLASAVEIVSKRNDYIIQINAAGAFFTGWFGGAAKIATKSVALSINTAYFISAAFDKDTQEVSIDVNNSGTRGTTATKSSTMDDGTNPLAFGGRPFGAAFLTGWMDEIGYCKGSMLTAAERTLIYNAGAGYNGFLP